MEVDATIQHERAVNLISTQVTASAWSGTARTRRERCCGWRPAKNGLALKHEDARFFPEGGGEERAFEARAPLSRGRRRGGSERWRRLRQSESRACRRAAGAPGNAGRLALGKVRAAAAAPVAPAAASAAAADPRARRAARGAAAAGMLPGSPSRSARLPVLVRTPRRRHRSRRRRTRARASDARRSSRRRLRWTVGRGKSSPPPPAIFDPRGARDPRRKRRPGR